MAVHASASAFDIPVAETQMGRFNDQRALIVERLTVACLPTAGGGCDCHRKTCVRSWSAGCQKYESDGGPGIVPIMDLLRQSEHPEDRAIFFKTQILFWMLAATDGHAKNSVFTWKPVDASA